MCAMLMEMGGGTANQYLTVELTRVEKVRKFWKDGPARRNYLKVRKIICNCEGCMWKVR